MHYRANNKQNSVNPSDSIEVFIGSSGRLVYRYSRREDLKDTKDPDREDVPNNCSDLLKVV